MKQIFAFVGFIALTDYIADGEFDWTKLSITEPIDAGKTIINWGERQLNRLTPP